MDTGALVSAVLHWENDQVGLQLDPSGKTLEQKLSRGHGAIRYKASGTGHSQGENDTALTSPCFVLYHDCYDDR